MSNISFEKIIFDLAFSQLSCNRMDMDNTLKRFSSTSTIYNAMSQVKMEHRLSSYENSAGNHHHNIGTVLLK